MTGAIQPLIAPPLIAEPLVAQPLVAEPLILRERIAVAEAHATRDAGNTDIVSIRLTEPGRRALAAFTRKHVGKTIELTLGGTSLMRTVIREPLATTTLSLVAENAAAAHQTAAALATHPLDLVLGPDADR